MLTGTPQRTVDAVLEEYGAVTSKALLECLPTGEPRRYLYDLVSDYPRRGGKMMRPSLCIATTRAFGGTIDQSLRSAVALELLHNALLIKDDIEDGSEERRGRPTLHEQYGIPLAINAGDAMTLMSLKPLIENTLSIGPSLCLRVLDETDRMARESAEGQALELGWVRDNVTDLTEEDYLTMVLKKTCWLATIFPLRVGALIATRDQIDLDQFIRFGFFLGASFQIHDDILNLSAEDQRYGKEANGDIWEGKRTLMLIRLRRLATAAERKRIDAVMASPRNERTDIDVRWIRSLMDHYGCIEYAREILHGIAGSAKNEFELLFGQLPDSRDKRFLGEVVDWVFERSH